MAQQQKSGPGSRHIRDVMTANPKTVSQGDTVVEVARIMRDQDTGVVPVVDGKNILGVVTDRDIVVRAIADGKECNNLHVGDVMTKSVRTVKEDATVDDVLNLMGNAEVRRVPVVNQSNELVGIVSIGDLAQKTNREGKVGETIEEISKARPNN
jgi:CBS domain-containing protein